MAFLAALAPAIMGAAGAATSAGAAAAGLGKSNYKFSDPGIDTSAYQLGDSTKDTYIPQWAYEGAKGLPGMSSFPGASPPPITVKKTQAEQEVDRFRQLGVDASNRGAFQLENGQTQGDYQRELQARDAQLGWNAELQNRAMGQGPSAAQSQLQLGMNNALASIGSTAASARGGPMAQIAAQRSAVNQAAMLGQNAGLQAATLRAQEMQQAGRDYAGQLGVSRDADARMRGMSQNMAIQQGQTEMAQRGLNQQARLGYEGMGQDTTKTQLEAKMRAAEAAASSARWKQQMESGQASQNAAQDMTLFQGGLGAAMGGINSSLAAMGGGKK